MRTLFITCLLLSGCSGASSQRAPDAGPRLNDAQVSMDASRAPTPADGGDAQAPWDFAMPCQNEAADLDVAPSATELGQAAGSVLRCVRGPRLENADVDRLARSSGYTGRALKSAISVSWLIYRTERGTEPPSPGFGSAVVLWPTTPRATELPVIVVGHGTVGLAPSCPPSRETPDAEETYLAELGYALAGDGYRVILPDFAGYAAFGAQGNPPPGYHAAVDEAKSMLDAARALRSLEPAGFSKQVVLMGHSQGGHAALSALAYHADYGSGGELAAVVAYAPSWFPMTSFPAMLALANSFPLPEEANSVAASVWYHYSNAELLDGPGAGVLLFAPKQRDAIRAFFERECDPDALSKLGKNIGDLFDPSFTSDVAPFAGLGVPCLSSRCATWMARYKADRPHLKNEAKSVPLLVLHGDADDWIPPERAKCGFDRLAADGANTTLCIVKGAKHDPLVGMRSEYVSDWIAWHTLGAKDPGTCGFGLGALVDEQGQPAVCSALPPND